MPGLIGKMKPPKAAGITTSINSRQRSGDYLAIRPMIPPVRSRIRSEILSAPKAQRHCEPGATPQVGECLNRLAELFSTLFLAQKTVSHGSIQTFVRACTGILQRYVGI